MNQLNDLKSLKSQHDELAKKGWKCKQYHQVGKKVLSFVPFEIYNFECRHLELQWTTQITHCKKGSFRKLGWLHQSEYSEKSFDKPEFQEKLC